MSEELSVFEKIAQGDLPSYKLYEDEKYLGILDAFPLVEGQALIFPKANISDDFWSLEPNEINEMLSIAQKISNKMQEVMDIDRVVLMVEGFDVPHVHIKLFPVKRGDVRLVNEATLGGAEVPALEISQDQFLEMATRISV